MAEAQAEELTAGEYCRAVLARAESQMERARELLLRAEQRHEQTEVKRKAAAWGVAALGFLLGVAVGVVATGIVV